MKKWRMPVVLVIALCLTLSGCTLQTELVKNKAVKYTMYIGLNDKDTYKQIITNEEAEKKVSDIALKHVDGFTRLSAKGVYKDGSGVITHENSLVFEFYSATDGQMKAIMDEVLKELNQNSILIEKSKVNFEFYEGETQ